MPAILMFVFGLASLGEAQVATHAVYQGRLTHTTGVPQAGPVNLTLRIFDVATAGSSLYSEQHLAVELGSGGSFAVPLGNGTNPSGSYTTAIRTAALLYLEIEVDGDVLSPRQEIASAAVAVAAGEHPAPAGRFEACANGLTIADHKTGLLWEKKTGDAPAFPAGPEDLSAGLVDCGPVECADPHNVNNRYTWSSTGTAPNGGFFTDFLAKLNDPHFGTATSPADVTGCFAGHCDWRLPQVHEFLEVLIGPHPYLALAQRQHCTNYNAPPCIDPGLLAAGVNLRNSHYHSATTVSEEGIHPAGEANWYASTVTGQIRSNHLKTHQGLAWAVRTGNCDE